ncbi:tail fiber protein [Bacillus phage BCPG3]|uniref:Minor tail protein n=2 Tax=Wphvirus TaxID=1922327 RepID=A0A173GBY7_9CAUD|nr:tail fiber protein [Bacillus phage BPS10C]YP_009282056.1 tail fiber protein [Bacillus phage SalinJah]QQO38763.1 tail lysin [Bacillus phage BCPG1]QSJ04320.1 tail fiber protein [Bacillus phage BCPG3]QSJ04533.1 tail fiber protein [Bacillus phage BCP18]AGI12243.1 putative tail fiber [Bacillus phage BPS10C]ANH50569.1 minor tail protein [Bacillus phage SalinJah]
MVEFEPLETMRFQSQLGKEMKRKYKEGNNLVTLALADVVKVNYKYNTVDVITVRDNNSTTKNPNDNGKYSAMLPTHMSGRTANGNIYGSTTLVTVGTRVLIGFIDGQVDTPIVINIYGKTDDQQQLTRTDFTAADDSIESIQQELWNTFNLYPSMTYDNIDGRGNREITFSGKTFLIMTDRDQENMYVQDAHFDYMDLPHSRYANGELIEPESPDAPTMLYVHQSVYDNHRTTFFVKADGTFRLGSRHISGGGITYQELRPDGSYSIVKKNDTENPEEESSDLSSIEILKDGNVVLQNPKTKMEITDEGVLVNGKPIGSGGSGGGISPELENIIKQINNQFSLLKITMSEIEGGLETKVEKDTYFIDTAEIEAKIKDMKDSARKSKDSLQASIEALVKYIANDVNTNPITDANKLQISKLIDDMDNKKLTLDGSAQTILLDPFLTDEQKVAVKKWYDKINSDHTALKTTVMAAMQDGNLTAQDKKDISDSAATYLNDLNSWLTEMDKAADASYEQRIVEAFENAVNYANKESLHQSAVITQLYNMISIKVSSEQVTQQFLDLNMKIEKTQEETSTALDDIQNQIDSTVKNLPYKVEVTSSNGLIFVNGGVNSTLAAKITKGTEDVTSTVAVADFVWTRVSNNSAADTAWNNAHKNSGRSFNINASDVIDRATFFCDYKKPPVATGSVTIANIQDITVGNVEPTNPREGALWYDRGTGIVWMWQQGKWVEINRFDVNIRNLFVGSRDFGAQNSNNPTDPNNATPQGKTSGGWINKGGTSTIRPPDQTATNQDTWINTTAENWGGMDYKLSKLAASGVINVGDMLTYACYVRTVGGTNPAAGIPIKMYATDNRTPSTTPFVDPTTAIPVVDSTTAKMPNPPQVNATQQWKMVWGTFTFTQDMMNTVNDPNNVDKTLRLEPISFTAIGNGGQLEVKSHILVKGVVPADWVPAPEDTKRDADNTNWNMDALGNDNYLTRFERGLVKTKLADITGESLSGAQDMKTSTQLDADAWGKGKFYAIRKQARDIAIDPVNDATYKALTTAYDALRTYLRALKTNTGRNTVYPWDTSSDTVMDVARTAWDKAWADYENAYASLTVLVQQKQKTYTDDRIKDVNTEIGKISKTGQHSTTDLRVPTTSISAPITTIALPSFKGNTRNNLDVGGVNHAYNTLAPVEVTGLKGTGGKPDNQTVQPYSINSYGLNLIASGKYLVGYQWSIVPYQNKPLEGSMYIQIVGEPWTQITPTISFSPNSPTSGVVMLQKNDPAFTANGITKLQIRFDNLVGVVTISNFMLTTGPTLETVEYSPNPTELRADGDYQYYNRNRAIAGVTLPTFYTAKNGTTDTARSSMTIQEVFHGDGASRDEFYWTEDGQPTKINRFADILLDAGYSIAIQNQNVALAGKRYIQVQLNNFADKPMLNNGTVRMANGKGIELSRLATGSFTQPDQFKVDYANANISFLVSAEEMNVTSAYQVKGQDVAFFLRGWKLFEGEPVQKTAPSGATVYSFPPYNATSGVAPNFTPIGYVQKDLAIINRGEIAATDTYKRPIEVAPPIKLKQTGQQWQIVYALSLPYESYCSFTGAIDLIGDPDKVSPTVIRYSYVDWTPTFFDKDGTFMYGNNLATAQEDTRYLIPVLERRIANAETKVETDSIKSVVFSSREYELGLQDKANVTDLQGKADKGDLTGLATKDELAQKDEAQKKALEDAMKNIDFTPYVLKSEIEQLDRSWTAAFFASGGMNIVKNSIGFDRSMSAKLNKETFTFWDDMVNPAYHQPVGIQTNALDALGFTSGFMFNESPNTSWTAIAQVLNVIPNQPYTISYFLQKMSAGDGNYRFNILVQESQLENPTTDGDWATISGGQLADNSSIKHSAFMPSYFEFTPTKSKIRLVLIAAPKCVAQISGIMVNIGKKPIKWTMSTGENYNTNVRMNLNGIRVSQVDKDGAEIGYTVITPEKFAGYYIRDGKPEEIFRLDGDETWTKKLRAENEINMGPIKILRVENTNNAGWAFISNY